MTQLEFCREHDARAIAHAQASEAATIPGVGDRACVPDERDACIYVEVAGRQFCYDEQGHLATVKLSCIVLINDEDGTLQQRRSSVEPAFALNRRGDVAAIPDLPYHCPRCACPMTLHQPDLELTERLLATCEYCKSWYLTNTIDTKLSPIRLPSRFQL